MTDDEVDGEEMDEMKEHDVEEGLFFSLIKYSLMGL